MTSWMLDSTTEMITSGALRRAIYSRLLNSITTLSIKIKFQIGSKKEFVPISSKYSDSLFSSSTDFTLYLHLRLFS